MKHINESETFIILLVLFIRVNIARTASVTFQIFTISKSGRFDRYKMHSLGIVTIQILQLMAILAHLPLLECA